MSRILRNVSAKTAPEPEPARDAPQTQHAPLFLLMPDAAGLASYHLETFADADAACSFLRDRLRGHILGHVTAFWALPWHPSEAAAPLTGAEPIVLMRDATRPAVVYPFSFTDMLDAYGFIRREVTNGANLGQAMLYWAYPARVNRGADGRTWVEPKFPPSRRAQAQAPDIKLPEPRAVVEPRRIMEEPRRVAEEPHRPADKPHPALPSVSEGLQELAGLERLAASQPEEAHAEAGPADGAGIGGPTRFVPPNGDDAPSRPLPMPLFSELDIAEAMRLVKDLPQDEDGATREAPREEGTFIDSRTQFIARNNFGASEAEVRRVVEEALEIMRHDRKGGGRSRRSISQPERAEPGALDEQERRSLSDAFRLPEPQAEPNSTPADQPAEATPEALPEARRPEPREPRAAADTPRAIARQPRSPAKQPAPEAAGETPETSLTEPTPEAEVAPADKPAVPKARAPKSVKPAAEKPKRPRAPRVTKPAARKNGTNGYTPVAPQSTVQAETAPAPEPASPQAPAEERTAQPMSLQEAERQRHIQRMIEEMERFRDQLRRSGGEDNPFKGFDSPEGKF